MNKRHVIITIIGLAFTILIVFWLTHSGWGKAKISGIIADLLGLTSMVMAYIGEEKRKKKKNSNDETEV